MAIKNINTIQNPNDFDYINDLSKEYILQSLTNLGQRIGVQGDSIVTNEFLFSSLVDGTNYNVLKYVGFIKKSNNAYVLGICERNAINKVVYSTVVDNTSNCLITAENCKLSKVINNIDYYDTNGKIIVTDNFYTFAFAGMKYVNNLPAYEEYICETIDKYTNTINSAVRFRTFRFDSDLDKLLRMIYLVKMPNSNNLYTVKIYTAKSSSTTAEEINNLAKNIDTELLTPENIINNSSISRLFDLTDILSNVEFDEASHTFNFTGEYSKLKEIINYFSYDLSYLYRFTKRYFSELVFNFDNEQLKKQIAIELFNLITSESNATGDIVYVPLNYVFNYVHNSHTEWCIYYNTLDIITKYVTQTQLAGIVAESDESAWICTTDKPERVSFYNYSVNYDPEDKTIVYSINVYKHFTLPYINGNNYWVLNDIDSNIYAKGLNAGNPNFVLIKTNETDTPDILAAASYTNILSKVTWVKKLALVKRVVPIDIDDESVATNNFLLAWFSVPDLSNIDQNMLDEYKIALENATIINLTPITNVLYNPSAMSQYNYDKDIIKSEYGEDGIISTLWHLNTGCTEFECIKQETITADANQIEYAVDFNYIANLNQHINYAVKNHKPKHPDKYLHQQLVFDNAYTNVKNSTTEEFVYVFPNIENIKSNEINNNFAKYYQNDLNLYIKFNDTVEGQPENITDISQSKGYRYYNDSLHTGASSNSVSNAIYTYDGSSYKLYNEYVPNYNVPTLDEGELFVRNQTAVNRVGFVTFDTNGKAFYSYIGSSYETSDKSAFVIGSSNTNINMGLDTIATEASRSNFTIQNDIKLNFDTTRMRDNADVGNNIHVHKDTITNGLNWNEHINPTVNSGVVTHVYSTQFTPNGNYIYKPESTAADANKGLLKLTPKHLTSETSYIKCLAYYNNYVTSANNNELFVINTVKENFTGGTGEKYSHNIYLGDGIYVPSLLHRLGLGDYVKSTISGTVSLINLKDVELTTNMKKYSYVDNVTSTNTCLVLQGTSAMLNDFDYYKYEVTIADDHIEKISNEIKTREFISNELQISYYINNNKLYLNVQELNKRKTMPYCFALTENYKA